MDLATTFAAFSIAALLALVCGWLGARPFDPKRGPRLFPYRLVMMFAGAGALLLLVHLVNLAGVSTGRG